MSSWSTSQPPKWAPNAIATDRGWVDPKTGHVLVANKRLENAIEYSKRFNKGGKPKRGGARPGAGRKPKDGVEVQVNEVEAVVEEVATPAVTPKVEVQVNEVEAVVEEVATPAVTPKKPAPRKKKSVAKVKVKSND